MGMFTSIVHPDDLRELQIKTGWDYCDTYRVGDMIPWTPDPVDPGTHIDGAYVSYSDKGPDDWVIIKGGRIIAVEPRHEDDTWQALEAKHGIQPPDPALWTEQQWQAKRDRETAWAEKTKGMSDIDILAMLMKGPSFASQIFPARKVE